MPSSNRATTFDIPPTTLEEREREGTPGSGSESSNSIVNEGHRVVPELSREPSTFQQTLTTLTQQFAHSTRSSLPPLLGKHARRLSEGLPSNLVARFGFSTGTSAGVVGENAVQEDETRRGKGWRNGELGGGGGRRVVSDDTVRGTGTGTGRRRRTDWNAAEDDLIEGQEDGDGDGDGDGDDDVNGIMFGEGGEDGDEDDDFGGDEVRRAAREGYDAVAWSCWDEVRVGSQTKRVLILVYKAPSEGIQVWDMTNLEEADELLNLTSQSPTPTDGKAKRVGGGAGHLSGIVSAKVLPKLRANQEDSIDEVWEKDRGCLLAILCCDPTSSRPTSVLHVYAFGSASVVKSLRFDFKAVEMKVNDRFIVLSSIDPPSLHIISSSTFTPLPFSPLTDLVPSPTTSHPIFDLSRTRLLSYVTSTKLPHGTGSGFIAANVSKGRGGGGSEGGNGDGGEGEGEGGVGQLARRLGGGVISGVKTLGDLGYSYWTTRTSSTNDISPPQQRILSKSAPQSISNYLSSPRSAATSSTANSPSFASSASPRRTSPSPSARHSFETTSAIATDSSLLGHVVVIDLVSSSSNLSSRTSTTTTTKQPRRTSRGTVDPRGLLRIVAHFRPSRQALSTLSFSPECSTSMLFVSSVEARNFDVFELRPFNRVGQSSRRILALSGSYGGGKEDGFGREGRGGDVGGLGGGTRAEGGVPKVWHRYRLNRGLTPARVEQVAWSDDGRFLVVGTHRGTAHVFGMRPGGGLPLLENQFEPQMDNPVELQPLSVTLSPWARVRSPKAIPTSASPLTRDQLAFGNDDNRMPTVSCPTIQFLPFSESVHGFLRPTSSNHPKSSSSSRMSRGTSQNKDLSNSIRDMVLFYPHLGEAILNRISVRSEPVTLASPGSLASADARDVGRLASSAVSGLSQLMTSRSRTLAGGGPLAPTLPAGNSSEAHFGETLKIRSSNLASWKLARKNDWPEHRPKADLGGDEPDSRADEGRPRLDRRGSSHNWVSQAELETFSRSYGILPRPIYLSHQFGFATLAESHPVDFAKGDYRGRGSRKVDVRREVEITGGFVGKGDLEQESEGKDGHDAATTSSSFGEPIRSAMHTVLDVDPAFLYSTSPSSLAPTFPNGVPGKHGTWRDAIPIRPMQLGVGGVNEGIGRMRRELGKVRISRRSGSNTAGTSGVSVSFDEDEAVFAENDLEGHADGDSGLDVPPGLVHGGSGSDSPPQTSLSDQGEEGDEGWNTWGLDDAMEEDNTPTSRHLKEGSRKEGSAEGNGEHDDKWDDLVPFPLDDEQRFPPIPAMRTKPASAPSSTTSAPAVAPPTARRLNPSSSSAFASPTLVGVPKVEVSTSPAPAPNLLDLDFYGTEASPRKESILDLIPDAPSSRSAIPANAAATATAPISIGKKGKKGKAGKGLKSGNPSPSTSSPA